MPRIVGAALRGDCFLDKVDGSDVGQVTLHLTFSRMGDAEEASSGLVFVPADGDYFAISVGTVDEGNLHRRPVSHCLPGFHHKVA